MPGRRFSDSRSPLPRPLCSSISTPSPRSAVPSFPRSAVPSFPRSSVGMRRIPPANGRPVPPAQGNALEKERPTGNLLGPTGQQFPIDIQSAKEPTMRHKQYLLTALLLISLITPLLQSAQPAGPPPASAQSAAERIRAALARPITVDYKDTPLKDVVADLQKKLQIPIHLDHKALTDLTIDNETTTITFSVSGISAKSALTLMLNEIGLLYQTENDVLSITTSSALESPDRLIDRIYDVTDLVMPPDDPKDGPEFDCLIELIISMVRPASWTESGPGPIRELSLPGLYVIGIAQTEHVHEDIAALLAHLRALRKFHEKQPPPPTQKKSASQGAEQVADNQTPLLSAPIQGISSAESTIQKTLARPIDLNYSEKPLTEVVKDLQEKLHVPVMLERKALNELTLDADTRITFSSSGIPAHSALTLMLRELGLSYQTYCEVLYITTPQQIEYGDFSTVRVYDVSDLPSYRDQRGHGVPDFDSMINLITTNLSPQSWTDLGGPGCIKEYQSDGIQVLVVSQTWQVHEKIKKLFSDLRVLRKRPMTKEDIAKLPLLPRPLPGAWNRSTYIHRYRGFMPDGIKLLPPLTPNTLREAFVIGTNDFAFHLYNKLSKEKDGNFCFSPYAIATALAQVQAAARGDTAREIANVLHLQMSHDDIPKAFIALQEAFPPKEKMGCELIFDQRLWYQENLPVGPYIFEGNSSQFEYKSIDFHRSEAARQTINQGTHWHVGNRIPDALTPGSIKKSFRSVLVDVACLFGQWQTPFVSRNTKPQTFETPDESIQTPLMGQTCSLNYVSFEQGEAVSIPYQGNNVSLVILLPHQTFGSLEKMEKSLSAEKISWIVKNMKPALVNLYLPRFTSENNFELAASLKSLGMKKAFDEKAAKFEGIPSGAQPLWVSAVFHKIVLKVDEQGTNAPEEMGMGFFGGLAGGSSKSVELRADHPFVFLILDHRTGTILFLGRLVEPKSETAAPGSTATPPNNSSPYPGGGMF
jgi:serine protease inhibitor